MSRQAPLPYGLPPKPQPHFHADSSGGSSYRPAQEANYRGDNYRPRSPPPMYEFRGDRRYDSIRTDDDRRFPARYEDGAPGNAPARSYNGTSDVYRPRVEGFTFRHEPPPSVDFRQADSYRNRSPPRQRARRQDNSNNFKSTNGFQNQRGRGGYRGRGGPRLASEREFLKGNRAPTPELMPGMDEDEGNGVRYKPIEDVSDSDEAEMDLSDDDNADAQQPKKKLARTETNAADGDSAPRWSNPDPYTALPPPDESQRKKKDVVKLIRKARVNTSSENATITEADADDFISFDFGTDAEDDEYDPAPAVANGIGMVGAPSGPRSTQPQRLNMRDHEVSKQQHQDFNSVTNHQGYSKLEVMGAVPQMRASNAQPRAPQSNAAGKMRISIDLTGDSLEGNRKRNTRDEVKGHSMIQEKFQGDLSLGNRKRNIRDEIKGPPLIHESSRGKKIVVSGEIVQQWRTPAGSMGTPWIEIDHSDTANMGLWLHKEIMDFYHFVKPRDFEQVIRIKLVEDLNIRVRQTFQDAEVRTFGSFPAGLYLPTADMDLVLVSSQYMDGGQAVHGRNSSALHRFGRWLDKEKLPIQGSVEVIPKAKVPLVKYVDGLTGLRVDISFENDTGLIANQTFQDWKTQFPAMPILVTVIKHLLAMRGLNEPVNGGIGGFSVTCLVVSLLQLMPQVQSRSMVPEHHLGEILMEFLDLYGNEFNTATTAIQLKPPGYISKTYANATFNVPYKNSADKFMIIDPNNSRNDISGGSHNSETIRKCFSDAYKSLQEKQGSLQYASNRCNQSILGCILAGNYSSFQKQREHLRHVHEKLFGPIQDS